MDNEYRLDYDAIFKTVREAEVVAFRFVTVPMRLLIDNRFTEVDAPLVKLVPKAESAEERFKSLKMMRPRFKHPSKISAIWWPRYVDSLATSGIWDAFVQRIFSNGFHAVASECSDILEELRGLEKLELFNAIAGEGYKTLWPVGR